MAGWLSSLRRRCRWARAGHVTSVSIKWAVIENPVPDAAGFIHVSTTAERFLMSIRISRAGFRGLAILLVPLSECAAHEAVGNRFFPATLGIDDPGVNDELALPTVSSFKTGDNPSVRQRGISGEFAKRITEAFAVSFGSTYTHLSPSGGPTRMGANGFQNFDTTFKYRIFKDPVHEFVMSVGVHIEWGGTECRERRCGAV
jgi:hypothetical protein